MALAVQLVGQWPPEIGQDKIQEVMQALLASHKGLPNGNINVKLVDDAAITALNKQYSGSAYVTDVLSFSYIENGRRALEGELGDIAISLPTARQQAQKADTDITTEIALLALHGVLHVLGWDHVRAEDREKLDQIQSDMMAAAGLTYRNFNWE